MEAGTLAPSDCTNITTQETCTNTQSMYELQGLNQATQTRLPTMVVSQTKPNDVKSYAISILKTSAITKLGSKHSL
jgi:hypothetical protein